MTKSELCLQPNNSWKTWPDSKSFWSVDQESDSLQIIIPALSQEKYTWSLREFPFRFLLIVSIQRWLFRQWAMLKQSLLQNFNLLMEMSNPVLFDKQKTSPCCRRFLHHNSCAKGKWGNLLIKRNIQENRRPVKGEILGKIKRQYDFRRDFSLSVMLK